MGPLTYFLLGWCLCQLEAPDIVLTIFICSMLWNLVKWVIED